MAFKTGPALVVASFLSVFVGASALAEAGPEFTGSASTSRLLEDLEKQRLRLEQDIVRLELIRREKLRSLQRMNRQLAVEGQGGERYTRSQYTPEQYAPQTHQRQQYKAQQYQGQTYKRQ